MEEIARRINAAFSRYGLTKPVVGVHREGMVSDRLVILWSNDPDRMALLADTIEHLVACHSESIPEQDGQLRLF